MEYFLLVAYFVFSPLRVLETKLSRYFLAFLIISCIISLQNSSQKINDLKHPIFQNPFETSSLPTESLSSESSDFSPAYPSSLNFTLNFPSFFFPITEGIPGSYLWSLYPEQIHLSWTENSKEICVMWSTYLDLGASISFRPVLTSGLDPNTWEELDPTTRIFNEGLNLFRIQYIHEAILTSLDPNLFYEYMVCNSMFCSEIFCFSGKSPFTGQSDEKEFKDAINMIILGDLGIGILGSETTKRLEAELRTRTTDGIFHLGDIAYDLDTREGRGGDEFFNMIQPIAANFPYMVLPGNHETAHNYTQYRSRFRMPRNQVGEGTNWFYSLNIGPCHFVAINSEFFFNEKQKVSMDVQQDWLRSDLEKANQNRESVPWIVVMLHRPLYCSIDYSIPDPCENSLECCLEAPVLKLHLEDLFYENKVDLVLQAHQHFYERNFPIYKNQTIIDEDEDSLHWLFSPQAPVYVTNGNAGNSEASNDKISETPQEWQAFASQNYGYGRLEVFNSTHLYYEQVDVVQMKIIDHFHIEKPEFKK